MTFTREELLAARAEPPPSRVPRQSETSPPAYPPRTDYREWWVSDDEWTLMVRALHRILEYARGG